MFKAQQWLAALVGLLCLSGGAAAAVSVKSCTFPVPGPGPWLGGDGSTLQITEDTPPGTVLARRGIQVIGSYKADTGYPDDQVQIIGHWTGGGGGALDQYGTMPTNITGIGLRWSYESISGETETLPSSVKAVVLAKKAAEHTGQSRWDSLYLNMYQELIVTGPSPGGQVTGLPGASTQFRLQAVNTRVSDLCNVSADFSSLQTGLNPPPIRNVCQLQTKSVLVDMGQYNIDDFPVLNGAATRPGQDFVLQLSKCAAEAKPKIQFTDASKRDNNSALLSISPEAEGGAAAAQGLALRLSRVGGDNGVITFGPEGGAGTPHFELGSPQSGMVEMKLHADYIRTGTIRPGPANGKAEFLISYP
ncbi:hypothetical protein VI26_02850 [Chromobacterium sp. LK1]|uniref:fimbrial protein n=1 Tax=Chromobacterium sp. LK1 TaxID=1628193 RepID=UPI0006547E4F|nr:fimbrial protein [Chromobacterium sp. LK1]KMN37580.1 hypothetical protein VI26_02850 [Chromobacterium sp. LK1]